MQTSAQLAKVQHAVILTLPALCTIAAAGCACICKMTTLTEQAAAARDIAAGVLVGASGLSFLALCKHVKTLE